jgi:cysteine-rich repeat protein
MSADNNRAYVVLEAVMDVPSDERPTELDRLCKDDAALRQEVERLVAVDDSLRKGPTPKPLVDGFALPPLDALLGAQLEKYEITGILAVGGMGTVYHAIRMSPYKTRVAIKVIKGDFQADALVRCFQRERQVLAALRHPNIASLLDGGSTPDGRPYLVMEFIPGLPLTQYCEVRRLGVAERLSIFLTLCEAVSHTHRLGVVHRDLKPANVLVTEGGSPTLIDFGIAKVLNPELSFDTNRPTIPQTAFLSPDYASPEHIRGESTSLVSDVYSLGVLLYELLTSLLPLNMGGRSPREIERMICDLEPLTPSVAVRRATMQPGGAIGDQRSIPEGSAERLERRLRGDLDDIVMMALRKEPWFRYQSVEALADDLRRYLKGLPVAASKGRSVYRCKKFLRRHIRQIGVVALAALVTAAGSGGLRYYFGDTVYATPLFVHGTPFPVGLDRVKPGTTIAAAAPFLSRLGGSYASRNGQMAFEAAIPEGDFRQITYYFVPGLEPWRVASIRLLARNKECEGRIKKSLIATLGTDRMVDKNDMLHWTGVCGMSISLLGNSLSFELERWVVTMPPCFDGIDNDSDGATDYPLDEGCTSWLDQSEEPECTDNIDNDGDGLVDYPADPDCENLLDNSESVNNAVCGDGIKQAGEQCDDGNAYNNDACLNNCKLNVCGDGVRYIGVEECDDGNAVEGDGCSCDCRITVQCNDGVDNDGDSLVDYPADPDCSCAADNSE